MTMRLSVFHRTRYRYDRPARFVTQSHRLTPASFDGQRVVSWTVGAQGAAFGAGFTDGAGDLVNTMTHPGPVEAIEIRLDGIVETHDTAGVLRGHRETVAPRVYLRTTAATAATRALDELRERALAGAGDASSLDRAHRLAAAVAEAVVYRPGRTHARTTAAEALEQGEGVCQDQAHVLIALARAAGCRRATSRATSSRATERARARAPRARARGATARARARARAAATLGAEDATAPAVHEASHAWAEVHVEGLGWVGFDAANRCCPDERYIRLGSGRDAQEAAPIRGVAGGLVDEEMDVEVVVAHSQQQ
jgi:transglutaminase-like putative cysteine protease